MGFEELCERRHAVRSYADEPVSREALKKVVEISLRTPSVCNRQSVRVRILDDARIIGEALKIQGGFGGYAMPPALMVVTSDLRAFMGAQERNEAFVDGGLFSMSLLYALESERLTACPLNAMFGAKTGAAMRALLHIPDNAVDSVKVYGNGTLIGTAAVRYDAEGTTTWDMDVAAPSSGDVEYKAVAVTRGDAKDDDTVNVNVTLPDADDTVIAADTKVLDEAALSDNPVLGVTDNTVTFANEPTFAIGDIIVSGVTENAPEGFLRRVKAIEHTNAGWVVTTGVATLTDAILQADYDESKNPLDDEMSLHESTDENPDVVVHDDGEENIKLVPVSDMDMTVGSDAQPQTVAGAQMRTMRSSAGGTDSREKGVEMSFIYTLLGGDVTEEKKPEDFSKAKNGAKKASEKAKATAGVKITASIGFTAGVRFKLKIDIDWNWLSTRVRLDEARITLFGEMKQSSTVEAYGQVEKKFVNEDFLDLNIPDLKFAIGPVPVVITADMPLDFTVKASGKIGVEVTSEYKRTYEQGVKYSNGGWHKVNEVTDNSSKDPACPPGGDSAELAGTLTAEAGLSLEPSIKLYGVVGPKGTIGFSGELVLKALTGTDSVFKVSLEANLKGTLGFSVVLTIPVLNYDIDEWKIAEVTNKKNLFTVELDFARECPTSPGGGEQGGEEVLKELPGHVTDASTGHSVSGATVSVSRLTGGLEGQPQTVWSDDQGSFSFTLVQGATYRVKVEKSGYVTWEQDYTISGPVMVNASLVPTTLSSTEWKAVLTWGESPRDVDSHLVGIDGNSYHVFYGDKSAYDDDGNRIAWLDVDDTTSYGPETLTFNVTPNGTYNYYLYNYSGEAALNTSGAMVKVYHNNQLVKTYQVPNDLPDYDRWEVFSVVNGQLVDASNMVSAFDLGTYAEDEPKKQ